MPSPQKAPSEWMWFTSQPKFWPKKPVMNVIGRKTVPTIVSR